MHDILMYWSDPVGIFGVIIILIAYFLLTTARWKSDNLIYQSLNFFGAVCILFSLYFHWNTASVLMEIAWLIISLLGIYRIYFPK